MIAISEGANINYLAKIVEIKHLQKHPNADKLQIAIIDFQNVILGLNAKVGDLYVFFPLECAISQEFLSFTSSFREKELNQDPEQTGFFEKNCRVRAVKLRGEKSMGYLVPISEMEAFTNVKLGEFVGQEFDMIGERLICKKYFVPVKESHQNRQGKKPKISRLVDGQVHLHVDTENLRKNMYKIKPEDEITVSYKVHGTSFWVSNVLVKRKLSILDRLVRFFGANVIETEYDYVYGSRKVVKNECETADKQHFYDCDIWGEIKEELKDFIPKNYTVYGEALGYTKNGKEIQQGYDYGCVVPQKKLQIYRITSTNADGIVHELSSSQIQEFCTKFNLNFVHVFYSGLAKNLFKLRTSKHWHAHFLKKLEEAYLEKDCFLCQNQVPAEGIVLRKESLSEFLSYKLKSFKFLERETKLLDEGVEDLESIN